MRSLLLALLMALFPVLSSAQNASSYSYPHYTSSHVAITHYGDGSASAVLNVKLPLNIPDTIKSRFDVPGSIPQALAPDTMWTFEFANGYLGQDTFPVITDEYRDSYTYDPNIFLRLSRTYPSIDALIADTRFAVGGHRVKCSMVYVKHDGNLRDVRPLYTFTLEGADHLFKVPLSNYVSREGFDAWIAYHYHDLDHWPSDADYAYDTAALDSIAHRIDLWEEANRKASAGKPYPFTLAQLIDADTNADTNVDGRPRQFDEETTDAFFHGVYIDLCAPNDGYTTLHLSVADLLYGGGSCTLQANRTDGWESHIYGEFERVNLPDGVAAMYGDDSELSVDEDFRYMFISFVWLFIFCATFFLIYLYFHKRSRSNDLKEDFIDNLENLQHYQQQLAQQQWQQQQAAAQQAPEQQPDTTQLQLLQQEIERREKDQQRIIAHLQQERRQQTASCKTCVIDAIVLLPLFYLCIRLDHAYPIFSYVILKNCFYHGKGFGVGSWVAKTHLIDITTDEPATFGRALCRGMVYAVLMCLCILPFVDFLLRLTGSRSIADRICGTDVVPDGWEETNAAIDE